MGTAAGAGSGPSLALGKPGPIPKRQLEIQLARLKTLQNPALSLEQYPVSPEVASELLYMAGFEHQDVQGEVIDLGTGTGRLAIGASLMGAGRVVGVDVDRRAITIAKENEEKARVSVDWIVTNLEGIRGRFDCVIMNPPYGTRVRHSDSLFLSHALELAPVVYSIHKSATRTFMTDFLKEKGTRVDQVRSARMRIPHLFDFHKRKWETIDVDLYRIVS